MDEVTVIGVDLAKRVFQVCGLSAAGAAVWEKRLGRAAFVAFMAGAPRVLVGLEACGGAHHWGRWLQARGFAVKLMAPRAVKPYRVGPHKNDARDARAVAEAAGRAQVAGVPVKGEAAQAAQATMRARERRVRQLVQTANQLRGLLGEFGFALPKGHARLAARLAELAGEPEFAALPAPMRELVLGLRTELAGQAAPVEAAGEAVAQAVAADPAAALLRSIPHLGPIDAAALSIALEAPAAFRNGRAFAASLRLAPRQQASAERSRLLGVGPMAASETRRYLVLAAHSLLTRASRLKEPPQDALLAWALRLLARKPRNVAAVAVAGKLARIAWAVLATGAPYRPRPLAA